MSLVKYTILIFPPTERIEPSILAAQQLRFARYPDVAHKATLSESRKKSNARLDVISRSGCQNGKRRINHEIKDSPKSSFKDRINCEWFLRCLKSAAKANQSMPCFPFWREEERRQMHTALNKNLNSVGTIYCRLLRAAVFIRISYCHPSWISIIIFRSVYNFLQQRDQLLGSSSDKADIIFLADFIFWLLDKYSDLSPLIQISIWFDLGVSLIFFTSPACSIFVTLMGKGIKISLRAFR